MSLTKQEKEWAIQLYGETPMDVSVIADKFDVAYQSISGIIKPYMPTDEQWSKWRKNLIKARIATFERKEWSLHKFASQNAYKLACEFVERGCLYSNMAQPQKHVTAIIHPFLPSDEAAEMFKRRTVLANFREKNQ